MMNPCKKGQKSLQTRLNHSKRGIIPKPVSPKDLKALIKIKTDAQIDAMRPAGHLAWELLEEVGKIIKPGITTEDINTFIHKFTKERGAIPAPLNYKGFPKSVCTSINDVVCHGIPSKYATLKEGDIINVDVTPILGGYHGDSSRTYFVGKAVRDSARRLVECTERCLDLAIAAVKPDCTVGDIGSVIQKYAESQGFSVVRDFVGHGIGKEFHEEPQIYHYGKAGKGEKLPRGTVFTIEPMINEGGYHCEILEDGWTAVTADGSLSAQFEHTLAIRHDGTVEVLTHPSYKSSL